MQFELTAYDIHHLVKEWQMLIGGRINRVYQPKEAEILILIYAKGKHMLRIALPSVMYLTQYKGEMPEQQLGFCKFLRKRLHNGIVTGIAQHDFERTVIMDIGTKEAKIHLIVELFSHGNIIVTDANNKILSLLAARSSEHRELRGGIEYTFPSKQDVHFLTITEEQFLGLVNKSSEENIVKILAKELGLGGRFAEEIICRAAQPKEKKQADLKKVFAKIQMLREEQTKARVYFDGGKPVGISPVPLLTRQSQQGVEHKTFNEAMDSILTNIAIVDDASALSEKQQKEIEKTTQVLRQQLATLEGREKEIEDCESKAQAIYTHYAKLSELLREMQQVAGSDSWEAMKKKFEKHPLVKKIDLKAKEVTVEVSDSP